MTIPTARAVMDVITNDTVRTVSRSGEVDTNLHDSHQHALLVQGCQFSLSQCELLLNQISQESYVTPAGSSTVGAHFRHVLDRFQCLLEGLPEGVVDYDARKRDPAIATSLDAAGLALMTITRRMETLAHESCVNQAIAVRESVHDQAPAVAISSSLPRELMGLISHTTHHLAIIALLAKEMGYTLDKDFGKAPSTIRFERHSA